MSTLNWVIRVKGKSLLGMSIAFALVFSALMTNVSVALPTTTMYVDLPLIYDTSKTPGSTFSVTIKIADVVDLYDWEARLSWDPALLDVTTVVKGPFPTGPEGTTFLAKKDQAAGYVDMACAINGVYSGSTGSGTLATITFLVQQTGETLLDLSLGQIRDHYGTVMPLVMEDGYFGNAPAQPADLVQRSAWPEYHHFVISKFGNIQTLYGKVRNLGTARTYVEVRFSGMVDGVPFDAATSPYVMAVGETIPLSANLDVAAIGVGTYDATAQVWYRYYSEILSMPLGPWLPGAKVKNIGFAVV